MLVFTLLKLTLRLSSDLLSYLRDRQLISAGEAKAIAEGLELSNDRLKKTIEARKRVVVDGDDDGVPDNDPFRRDSE